MKNGFIKLTDSYGHSVYVNPQNIAWIEEYQSDLTEIHFNFINSSDNPYILQVKGGYEQIIQKFSSLLF